MLQLPFISYQSVASEETLLTVSNQNVYEYLIGRIKNDFGFEKYLLEITVSEENAGEYQILLAVSEEVLERHLNVISAEVLNQVAGN